ncbi:ribonuclease Z [Alicyclobacillus dauci]|uniref:Ribonuclease Z n=1 Tax=Alicyclobacillus dauci TaxID=1475485 RepID=A0ABY6Z1S1_9BACL|nr:ribonuclease Z [Alicyclobacillus dauci]WAH36538.1 ribonuclease Z [Alicyclobacillus dauci]
MDLYFLGTGAGLPSKRRNVTSIALRLHDERGTFWLIDCGEATQHKILSSPLSLSKLEHIFITHLHGDHIFGLPGLLGSRGFQAGEKPLVIYGPRGLEQFVETTIRLSETHLPYRLWVSVIDGGVIFDDEQMTVTCRQLNHGIPSYGYRFEEKPKRGKLRQTLLQEQGIPAGPIYGKLKEGHDVALDDGRVLRSADYLAPPTPGRVVTILGDTRPCDSAEELAEGADVLVHEATYAASEWERAQNHHHSTATDAARTAANAGVKQLVLTHVSARYDEEGEAKLLADAQAIFPATTLAHDHLIINVPRLPG